MGGALERHPSARRTMSHSCHWACSVCCSTRTEQAETSDTTPVKPHDRQRPTGRKPLPETLPRVDIYVLPDDVQRRGLDAHSKIGEDISEVLERRSASMVVARIIKPKFVLKDSGDATTILQASTPRLPLPHGGVTHCSANVVQGHRPAHVRQDPTRVNELAVGRCVNVAHKEPTFREFADRGVEFLG